MTPKQQAFVSEYLVDLCGAKAAMRAGYSPRTAKRAAYELLQKEEIQAALATAMQARQQRTEVTIDRVVQELARLAFHDIGKLFDADGAPLRIADLDEDTRRAVAGLEVVSVGNSDAGIGQVMKFKLVDKPKVLELLLRHLGAFTEKLEVTGKDGGPVLTESTVQFYLPSNGR
jgi:phage terminase small subunit